MLSQFLFLSTLLLLASSQDCLKGRLTQYSIFNLNKIPQGTCSFGPIFNLMPEEFRSGRILAANQDYYNGFVTSLDYTSTCTPQNGTNCGLRCGECVLVTGARGSASYIIGDIGDYTTSGIENVGDMTQFALNNFQNEDWNKIADDPGYELMTFRPVPCSTTGNLGFYFPESGSNKVSVAFLFYNYKIQIKSVEVQGVGESVKTPNDWMPLIRQWNNKFVWRGVENFTGQSGDIYNGGYAFKLRITSIFGEVIQPNDLYAVNNLNKLYDLGAQFKLSKYIPGGGCLWSGPTAEIYADKVSNRKLNKLKKNYDKCTTNPSCRTFLSGPFLVEWHLESANKIKNLDLEYAGQECQSKICIEMAGVREGSELVIGHSSAFYRNDYSNVTFKAKLLATGEKNTTTVEVSFYCNNPQKFEINSEWNSYSFAIKSLKCPDFIKNIKFSFGEADSIYLDDISLTGPNSNFIDPNVGSVVSPLK